MNQLPDKLSDCLELALRDLEACEADPAYRIYMDDWHWPSKSKTKCRVCLAGSVMAKTIGVPIGEYASPYGLEDCGDHDSSRLSALNDLRLGWLHEAIRTVHGDEEARRFGAGKRAMPVEYRDDPAAFKSDMRGIVDLLRKAGL